MDPISRGIDGTLLLARTAVGCFRILRSARALATCAHCLEAHSTLDAMRRVRMRVFVALRARFKCGTVSLSGPDGVHGCLEWYAG